MSSGTLDGKVAIVTGAGGGIGRVYARGLAEQGAKVVLADVNADAAAEAAGAMRDEGHDAIATGTDVTSEQSCVEMAAKAVETFGRIDILVNNAALMSEIPPIGLTSLPIDFFDRVVQVNLRGPLLCTRAVLPAMKEGGGGKIVNQSSGGAFLPSGVYGMTKIGLVSMTASLAQELAPFNIRVNAIAPGWVNTEAGLRSAPAEYRALIKATVPIPFGEPEELLGALVFLASSASDWVTGQTINVDGGWVNRI